MTSTSSADNPYLEFCYRLPIGVVELSLAGEVRLMNPAATSLLYPLMGDRLFTAFSDALTEHVVGLSALLTAKDASAKIESARVIAVHPSRAVHLELSAQRFGQDSVIVTVSDATLAVREEARRKQEARGAGQDEVASEVQHELGNRLSSMSTRLGVAAKCLQAAQKRDVNAVLAKMKPHWMEEGWAVSAMGVRVLRLLELTGAAAADEILACQTQLEALRQDLDALETARPHRRSGVDAVKAVDDAVPLLRKLASSADLAFERTVPWIVETDFAALHWAMEKLLGEATTLGPRALVISADSSPRLLVEFAKPITEDALRHGGPLHGGVNRLRAMGLSVTLAPAALVIGFTQG